MTFYPFICFYLIQLTHHLKLMTSQSQKQKLEGSFKVRIYDDEFLVPNLIKNSRVVRNFSEREGSQLWDSSKKRIKRTLEVDNLDVVKLAHHLSKINYSKVCERRNLYQQIYQVKIIYLIYMYIICILSLCVSICITFEFFFFLGGFINN